MMHGRQEALQSICFAPQSRAHADMTLLSFSSCFAVKRASVTTVVVVVAAELVVAAQAVAAAAVVPCRQPTIIS